MSLQIPTPPLTRRRWFAPVLAAIAMIALAEPTLAQHTLQRTLTVDKSGSADFTTIQAAINSLRIGANPTNRITVLIYAGKYPESVTLDGTRENVDLVGVDRDAVIIAPVTGNGITITSGTEISRNNTIRNLTIQTIDGHGIEIIKGTGGALTPKNIIIEDCVIEADGTGKDGIEGDDAASVLVRNCLVQSDDDDAIVVGNDWRIDGVTAISLNAGDVANAFAVDIVDRDNLFIVDSDLQSDGVCVRFSDATNTTIERSQVVSTTGVGGAARGVLGLQNAVGLIVSHCTIESDGRMQSDVESVCVFSDFTGVTGAVFEYCSIIAYGGEDTRSAIGVKWDKGKDVLFRECIIIASNIVSTSTPSDAAEAWGIQSNLPTAAIVLKGGMILTSTTKEKDARVYDVGSAGIEPAPHGRIEISGTRLSKWFGPVESSERRRSMVQRVLAVSPASTTAVLGATTLLPTEKVVTTGITNPDVYRVVSVTGSSGVGTDKIVYIIGTNFAGDAITDAITLNNDTTVVGVKPFATITKIILPGAGPGESVSVGVSSKLGLQFPIGDTADIIQIGRKASGASSYTIAVLSSFTVDDRHATVAPGTITSGDSFEFIVLSSQ